MKKISTLILYAAFSFILMLTNSNAQAISKENTDRIINEVKTLREQIGASNKLVNEKGPKLTELKDIADKAPEVTEQMIKDLEGLVDKFKNGSETANVIQDSMRDIKIFIDKFREGSNAQQLAAKSLRKSLAQIEESDAQRDKLVGDALIAIRKLKAQKDDLIAFQIAAAYSDMAAVYKEMLGSFEKTVNSANTVVDSIETSTGAVAE